MSTDDTTAAGSRPPGNRFCTQCGTRLYTEDRFCPTCGADVQQQAHALTERLQSTAAEREPDGTTEEAFVPVPAAQPARARRRRPWYRRPLVVVPLILLACILVLGGAFAYRTYTALNTVQSLTTPPAEVSSSVLGVENGDAVIDTGPAQEAVRLREEAREQRERSGEPDSTETTDTTGKETGVSEATEAETEVPGLSGDGTETAAPATTATSEPTISAPFLTRPTSTPDPDATATATTVTEPATETAAPTEAPEGTAEPTAAPGALPVIEGDLPGVNILLMGVDARENEAIDVGVRPDALAVLNLNEDEGTCRVLSIPRDSRVSVPGYGMSKINHALAVGGIPFEMLVVEDYLGITLDHYALIDFAGLVKVVDAFGGVTVDNDAEFTMDGEHFAAGEIHLDGERALLYARYRGGSDGDFGRVENQQQIVRSLVDSANRSRVISLIPDAFTLLQDNFRTDFGVRDLVDLADTFVGECTGSTVDGRTIPGNVATMFDDMMKMDLSFVVSSESDIADHVRWLLFGDDAGTSADSPDTSASDQDEAPAGTPGPTGEATPPPRLFGWRQDQGW